MKKIIPLFLYWLISATILPMHGMHSDSALFGNAPHQKYFCAEKITIIPEYEPNPECQPIQKTPSKYETLQETATESLEKSWQNIHLSYILLSPSENGNIDAITSIYLQNKIDLTATKK